MLAKSRTDSDSGRTMMICDELDRRHEDVERPRHAGREHRSLEVAEEALLEMPTML